jgi:transcriptional regulator with XRE-family HTH domain
VTTKSLEVALTAQQLRQQRIAAGIPGRLVCAKAGIDRGRLSDIERGYTRARNEELQRISEALGALLKAKEQVTRTAAEVGWPMT